jgi:hypothetical protein
MPICRARHVNCRSVGARALYSSLGLALLDTAQAAAATCSTIEPFETEQLIKIAAD